MCIITFCQNIYGFAKAYLRIKYAHEIARVSYLSQTAEMREAFNGPVAVKYTWKQLPMSTKRRFHCDWWVVTMVGLVFLLISSVYQLGMIEPVPLQLCLIQ